MVVLLRKPRKFQIRRLSKDQLKIIDEVFKRLSGNSQELVFNDGSVRIRATLSSITKFKRLLECKANIIGEEAPLNGEGLDRFVWGYDDIMDLLNNFQWKSGSKA